MADFGHYVYVPIQKEQTPCAYRGGINEFGG